ncbi:MAG: hypothetical protein HZB40_13475 [Rhodocyclales bacterium]|nr:hypothetical protein [Rhodocyclales bacterium]
MDPDSARSDIRSRLIPAAIDEVWAAIADAQADYQHLAAFVAIANEQNLDRLAAEARRGM